MKQCFKEINSFDNGVRLIVSKLFKLPLLKSLLYLYNFSGLSVQANVSNFMRSKEKC
jgi:hypothetical protein